MVRSLLNMLWRNKSEPAKSRDLSQIFGLDDGAEPEVVIRLRGDAEWLRARGYCESDIASLAELKAELYMDKYEGWSSQPQQKA